MITSLLIIIGYRLQSDIWNTILWTSNKEVYQIKRFILYLKLYRFNDYSMRWYTIVHVQVYNSLKLVSYQSKIWRKNVYAHMSNTTRWFVHEFCVWLICPLRYVKRKIFHTLYLTTNFKLHLHNIMCTNIIIRCDKLSYQTRYNVVLKKSYNKMTSQNTR